MSDHEVPPEDEHERPEDEHANETSPQFSRRDFVARSAQVAVLSLFGIGALEPVIECVLSRVGEMRGMERIAASTARHLRESGVIGVAYADCQECKPAANYTCHAGTTPTFSGCTYGAGFRCEWEENFFCTVTGGDAPVFDCDKEFGCPPWVGGQAWFDCSAQFQCTYREQFNCGGSHAGYLCPDDKRFYTGCDGQTEWTCSSNQGEFTEHCFEAGQDPYECQGQKFVCDGKCHFFCGIQTVSQGQGEGGFDCDQVFQRSGGAAVYDFMCNNTGGFDCGDAGQGEFTCDAGHTFTCSYHSVDPAAQFECIGKSFTCAAGGARCGFPETGNYAPYAGDTTPGDFLCHGHRTHLFACDAPTAFTCKGSADDFQCVDLYEENAFACELPFGGCQPSAAGGQFKCQDSREFNCKNPTQFQCQPASAYADVH